MHLHPWHTGREPDRKTCELWLHPNAFTRCGAALHLGRSWHQRRRGCRSSTGATREYRAGKRASGELVGRGPARPLSFRRGPVEPKIHGVATLRSCRAVGPSAFQHDRPLQVSSPSLDDLTRRVGGSACAEGLRTVGLKTSFAAESGLGNSGASPHRTHITRLAPGPCTAPGRVCPKPAPGSGPRV